MSDASDSLARVGLDDRLWSAPVAALSAGQRRKLAIASIIVSRPRLWLLDEPHAALDSEGRLTMNSIMEEVASLGATVVFASHDKELSEQLASSHHYEQWPINGRTLVLPEAFAYSSKGFEDRDAIEGARTSGPSRSSYPRYLCLCSRR